MITWQEEATILFNEVPGAAERIARAIDSRRLDGTALCPYNVAHDVPMQDHEVKYKIWENARRRFTNGIVMSPLEAYAWDRCRLWDKPCTRDYSELRDHAALWLAEHGTTLEPTPAPHLTHTPTLTTPTHATHT